MKSLNLTLMNGENNMSAEEALDVTTDLVFKKLSALNSTYKRKKEIESNKFYVPPEKVAIGTRWEVKKIKSRRNGRMISVPRIIQCSFEYVSIVSTLRALFKCDDFRNLYLEYNANKDHVCESGKFRDFCCTKTYQENELFKNDSRALQIQISSDDFEICNPLQSKANRHKICGVYFTIRNLPTKYLSKLNNIYLICLCNTDDLKTKRTDYNNIWRRVVKDIKFLETVGINISDEINIKGTLIQLSFDNLGANTALGFSGGFNSTYYCRKCECTQVECQYSTREDFTKKRTTEKYEEQILAIAEQEKIKLKDTKGIKYYCALSDCNFFHILNNPTVDIMHDINEGAIPFLIKTIFNHCISLGIFSLEKVNSLIQFHDYGWLRSRTIPSEVNLEKRSLGQNASQSLCLFQSLPYILYNYRNEYGLKSAWVCVTSLLRIIEAVYSHEITDRDLETLENDITTHLSGIKAIFNVKFIPKHHFVLHYPSVIRDVGPVVNMSMMRYESKHKVFKTFADNTNNFIDINRTLALKHQELLCSSEFTYKDNIECGKLNRLSEQCYLDTEQLLENFTDNSDENIFEAKWLTFNDYQYRKGLLILHENFLFEIFNILCLNSRYVFLTKQWIFVEHNEFLNSFQIKENDFVDYNLIRFESLANKKSYEVKVIDKMKFVIADTLDLRKSLLK